MIAGSLGAYSAISARDHATAQGARGAALTAYYEPATS
jgi:hypothetical protein